MILPNLQTIFLFSSVQERKTIAIITGCLLLGIVSLIVAEIHRSNKSTSHKDQWIKERQKYFDHCEWFGLTEEQSLENLRDMTTITQLMELNRHVEKIIGGYKKEKVSV